MTPQEAWAAVVSGEDAAVYAYGLVGPLVDAADQARARSALDAHRLRRDRARAALVAAGQTPPPAAAAYDPPFPVGDAAAAGRLAATVEERLVPVYADLAGASDGDDRRYAARTAQECATRAVSWGAAASAFPGTA